MLDVLIVGAGPYGISLAAHAQHAGLSYKLIGEPMHFWKQKIPQSMFIRTHPALVSFSAPNHQYTIQSFSEQTNTPLDNPLPRSVFIAYAAWFAEQVQIEFTPHRVTEINHLNHHYIINTTHKSKASSWLAKHVIIATGLEPFAYIPEQLSTLPKQVLYHTYGLTDYSIFHNRSVAVIGSGQSAWEAAALLHLEGATPELLFRKEQPYYGAEDNLPSGLKLIESAAAFFSLPIEEKEKHWNTPRKGSVASFLRSYVDGKVPWYGNKRIEKAILDEKGCVELHFQQGEPRTYEAVIAGTGYRVKLDDLPFLPQAIAQNIQRETLDANYPKLNNKFESSVAGLFFAGPLSSFTHGPAFGFIAGLQQACESIIPYIQQSLIK